MPQAFWRQLREDLLTFVLLAVLLFLASSSIVAAAWTGGLRGTVTIALLGLLVGYMLARSRFSDLAALTIGSVYGLFAIGLQQTVVLRQSGTLQQRALEMVERVAAWAVSALSGGFNQDDFVFVVALAIVFWYLGYNAARTMFRGGRLWRAVVPPGIALLVNLSYYAGELRLDLMLLAYLFVALLLAVRTNILAREGLWRDQRMSYQPGIRFELLRAGVLASVALLALAWLAPTGSADERLSSLWEQEVAPRIDLRETWDRLFSLEGGSANTANNYYGGQTLPLGGSINLSDRPVMNVYAPPGPRYYWRSKVFDSFDGHTWTTTSDARLKSEFGVLYYEDATYALRRHVRQRFDLLVRTSRLVYAASQPTSVSLPVAFDVLYIDRSQERGTLNEMRAVELLQQGDTYEAISSLSYADENSLRAAGTDYPGWVQRTYLQVPQSTTDRTRSLAASLTQPYDNPYDKAESIENWLRQNITYNEDISPPPSDGDAVDWMLFEERQGYCTYFASAMVVMLRAQGIPARMATGFAQGEYDTRTGAFHVVESDAHTWVEVYFSGYGWVEFEPTAAQPPIAVRGDLPPGGAGGEGFGPDVPSGESLSPESPPAPGDFAGGQGLFGGATGSGAALAGVWRLAVLLAVLLGGAFVVGGALGWRAAGRRGLRGLSRVARFYAMLNVMASWLGLRLPASFTPDERADILSVEVPEAAVPIHEITAFYVRERYAAAPARSARLADAGDRAGAAWQAARPALLRRVFRRFLRPRQRGPRPDHQA